MKHVVVAVVVAFAVVLAAFPVLDEAPVASACSSGTFDAVRDSPIIASGTFTGWEYVLGPDGQPFEREVPGASATRPEWIPKQRLVQLQAEITGVYKGALPQTIVVATAHFDRYLPAEGQPPFDHWAWPGEAGQCFGMAADPTGQSAVLFLRPSETRLGEYDLLITPGVFGEDTPGLGEPRPPSVGNSPPDAVAGPSDDWLFVSAIGGGCLLLTLLLVLVGPRRERRR